MATRDDFLYVFILNIIIFTILFQVLDLYFFVKMKLLMKQFANIWAV